MNKENPIDIKIMYYCNLFIFYYINKIEKFSNLNLINHTWNQLCTKKYKKEIVILSILKKMLANLNTKV